MKQREQPNYYAILTADVRYSKELNFFEKVLYADITALTNKNGYCTATNQYFAHLFGKTKGTISKAISRLERVGFLEIVISRDKTTKQIIDRKLYLKTTIPIVKNNHRGIVVSDNAPMVENHQENITSNNTINNNTLSKEQKRNRELSFKNFKEILEKTNFTFKTQGLGYLKEHKGFQIKNGFIYNLHSEKYLDKEEAYKIWEFLYQHKEEALKNAS